VRVWGFSRLVHHSEPISARIAFTSSRANVLSDFRNAPDLSGDDAQTPALEFFLQRLDLVLKLFEVARDAPQRSTSCSLVSAAREIPAHARDHPSLERDQASMKSAEIG
jgi:hypothetical protein